VSRKMGIFQYMLSVVEGLISSGEFDCAILYFDNESPREFLKAKDIGNVAFIRLDGSHNNFLGKIKTAANVFLGKSVFTVNKLNKEAMENKNISLLIMPSPLLFGFEHNIPYIVPIPDMMYKYYPGLPEYSFYNNLISHFVFKYSAKYAVLCVADSEWGKNDIKKFLKQPAEKIKVIPFMPPGYIYEYKNMSFQEAENLLKKYNLPEKFIFYPAQFWTHKNHLRLVEAVKKAEDKYGQKINLVLVGNEKANEDNYLKIMRKAEDLGIRGRIFNLGYVPDKEIVALYKKSLALCFCSLGGPTNIPIIEAMVLGVPVLCPDLFAMPDQVGEAGLLFDPFNHDDMAEKIHRVWTDENLRQKMIDKGYEQVKSFTFEKCSALWISAVKEALKI